MEIGEYIRLHYNGSQAAFARHIGVSSPAVSMMKRNGFIIIDGRIWSARRNLPAPPVTPPAYPLPRSGRGNPRVVKKKKPA